MPTEDDIIVGKGDIVLIRGSGCISSSIRYFTKSFGESRTLVNHCAIVVENGTLNKAVIVEALTKVKKHSLWIRYGPPSNALVTVFRPRNLSLYETDRVVITALQQVGKTYGYTKLVAHLLDWCLCGAYVFRRIADSENYPICSWLVAHAYASVGKSFGVEIGKATPDDIFDFCLENPHIYSQKRNLVPIYNQPNWGK
jgi:hypothetical protein